MHKGKRTGHVSKICRSKPNSGINQKKNDKARVATAITLGKDEDEPAKHEASALRSELGTPKLLL